MREAQCRSAEWLLGFFAGRERGAAIYGDLVELAATRGSAWFWMAYARTLAALTWRPAAAFVVGAAVSAAFLCEQLPIVMGHIFLAISHPHVWPTLDIVTSDLWFFIPFAAVLYGIRDEVVKLMFAMLVATCGAFYLGLWLDFDPVPIACIAGTLLTLGAAVSRWRTSLVPLAGIWVASFAISEADGRVKSFADLDYRDPVCWALVLVYMLATSVVFCGLHGWVERNRAQSAGAAKEARG